MPAFWFKGYTAARDKVEAMRPALRAVVLKVGDDSTPEEKAIYHASDALVNISLAGRQGNVPHRVLNQIVEDGLDRMERELRRLK